MRTKSEPSGSPRKGVNTRITDDLREMLERSAAVTHRTLGNEIEHRLRESFASQPDIRTIIREEIEADRERQRKAVMERARIVPGGYIGSQASNLAGLASQYGGALSYLNGEPKTDH